MTHAEKVAWLTNDLKQRDVDVRYATHPLCNFLWRSGWMVPPPLFQSFLTLVVFMGAFFGVPATSFLMLIILVVHYGMAPLESLRTVLLLIIAASMILSLSCGLTIATLYRTKAITLNLPPWERYPEESHTSVSQDLTSDEHKK